jgi:hypothetical protein
VSKRTIAAAMQVPAEYISMDMEVKLPGTFLEKLGLEKSHGNVSAQRQANEEADG